MRTQLFRKSVLVDGAAVVAVRQDLDGVDPLMLVVENMDVAASGRTKFGSKNANLRFVAVTPGAGGNAWSVVFHAAAGQAISFTSLTGTACLPEGWARTTVRKSWAAP